MDELVESGRNLLHNTLQRLHRPPHIANAMLRGLMYRATHVRAAFVELEKLEKNYREKLTAKEEANLEVTDEERAWHEQLRIAYEYASLFRHKSPANGS